LNGVAGCNWGVTTRNGFRELWALGHLSFGGPTQGVTYLAICLKSVNACLSYV